MTEQDFKDNLKPIFSLIDANCDGKEKNTEIEKAHEYVGYIKNWLCFDSYGKLATDLESLAISFPKKV